MNLLLINAIRDALREMEAHPDDSVTDIWNEQLASWQTGLRMDNAYNIEPDPTFIR